MPTNLSAETNQLIAQELALGRYGSEEELLTEAVELLSQRNALRSQIEAGRQQLDAGDFTDYDSQSLWHRFEELKASKYFNAKRAE